MNRSTRNVACVVALGTATSLGAIGRVQSPPATPTAIAGTTDANITRLTTSILGRSQFAHHPLDRELAGKLLDSYLDALDGAHSLFLQSDMAELSADRDELASATRSSGDVSASRRIFERYLERLTQRTAYVTKRLRDPRFDFTGHDTFSLDREHAQRPRDMAAAEELWSQQLRAEYLQEKLSDVPKEQIAGKLTRRYARQLEAMKGLRDDEVLEVYLNALAHVYDPHSDYLGHEQMESLSIAMNLSLFGIGASLENADGYCTIREVLPGGPAARGDTLKPGDRIVAVAQAGKDRVDVVNLPLSRTVELIRGPKGSTVILSVIPAFVPEGSPPRTVSLVRDEVQLADQQAKASIVDLPRAGGATRRLGVIDVPAFYADMGNEKEGGRRSVTADVARLVTKLKAENVKGIVLDLRRNGGGSLKEAISLTGLFIDEGPVVQTRGATGDVEVDADPDPTVLYDGPLVVLTSRFSASASEILAGALQDYGRAVVVGDSSTFGKGTVQSILPLARIMDQGGLAHAYDPGALKVTIRKFYRPGGASTQLRGVASDIVLPSSSDLSDVSESALKNPLPWDAVPAARYGRLSRVAPYLAALRAKSAQRVATEKEFAYLEDDVARLRKSLSSKSISLNEAERRRERTEAKIRQTEREQERAKLHRALAPTYDVTLANVSSAGLPPPASSTNRTTHGHATGGRSPRPASIDDAADQGSAKDILLDEVEQILADYTELLHGANLEVPPTTAGLGSTLTGSSDHSVRRGAS